MWREGHIIPDSGIEILLEDIKSNQIPCINHPEVTLKCMNTELVIQECLNNEILSKYCAFKLVLSENLVIKPPIVVKLPNYHGGLGKWFVRSPEDMKNLLEEKQEISWGKYTREGFLTKKPFLSENIIIEPFIEGRDTRVYVYFDRKDNQHYFKYLERTIKEGHWLANRHTDTFEVFEEDNKEIENICMEALKILDYPDLVGIDLIRNEENITILEINNDVPGLTALDLTDDYSIHKTLLSNLQKIV